METTNKKTIINLLLETKRRGIRDLINWMDDNGFFDAPCSSKYHLSKPGGLAEHSLNVFDAACKLASSLCGFNNGYIPKDTQKSIIICALLHDLGKAGQFGKPGYITAELPFEQYETNKDLLYIPHEVRSIAIASQFIELTEEEQFAILYHNGLYGELKSLKGNETPLYMILHFADMWASRIVED